jgi:hypothetical protein
VPHVATDPEGGRLYRWIQALHSEYKSLQNGQESRILNGTRISSLVNIGFKFQM